MRCISCRKVLGDDDDFTTFAISTQTAVVVCMRCFDDEENWKGTNQLVKETDLSEPDVFLSRDEAIELGCDFTLHDEELT